MNRVLIALCLTGLIGMAAGNLLTNGDFEQTLDVGWTDTVVGSVGSSQFERTDTLGQTTGYAARVVKYLASYAALGQTVTVPNTNLTLSFDGRFRIGGGSSTCWPVAAMFIRYLDNSGAELGNTKMILHGEFCNWTNSDSAHLIEIEIPEVWQPHTLDVAQEISNNLPGVNPANVKQIRIELFAYDNGT
jgi:hypothetical protein